MSIERAVKYLEEIGDRQRADHLSALYKSFEDPQLRVVVFGEFNRGKSTIINAMLGRIVLPTKLVPTTGHSIRITYGNKDEVRIQHLNGRTEFCSLDKLDSFSSLDRDGVAREDIEDVEVSVNSPFLQKNIIIFDTPGVSERETQTRRAMEAISKADIVLLVLSAQQLLGEIEHRFAVEWLTKGLGKPVIPVLNFMNLIPQEEQHQVRERLTRWCFDHIGKVLGLYWYEVNAKGALSNALGKADLPADDFNRLCDDLKSLVGSQRTRLQLRSRCGQLMAELQIIGKENEKVVRQLSQDAEKLQSQRKEELRQLESLRNRFEADARLNRDSVCLSAQQTLNQGLESLVGVWFKGEGKSRLDSNATRWYEMKFSECVTTIQKNADDALTVLAREDLRSSEPMTIRERMILSSRLNVGELPAIDASDAAVGWSAGIGAVLGSFVLPIVGTALGAFFGGWLGSVLGSSEPDYAAVYSNSAREKWAVDSSNVVSILQAQYDARVEEMKQQIDAQIERIRYSINNIKSVSTELSKRRDLAVVLEDSMRKLRHEA